MTTDGDPQWIETTQKVYDSRDLDRATEALLDSIPISSMVFPAVLSERKLVVHVVHRNLIVGEAGEFSIPASDSAPLPPPRLQMMST